MARAVSGYDAVINATRQTADQPGQTYTDTAHDWIDGLTFAGVSHLLVVGGAGILEVAPGLQLVDIPDFPAAWRPGALAPRDALAVYRAANLDWKYFSPADRIAPGERTGHNRIGNDQLVTNEEGESRISAEDYAVALIDELETPRFIRRRFTAAY